MILYENNLRIYVIKKLFRKNIIQKYNFNLKLLDALDEYIYYSNNNNSIDYTNDIININKINRLIKKILNTIKLNNIFIIIYVFTIL